MCMKVLCVWRYYVYKDIMCIKVSECQAIKLLSYQVYINVLRYLGIKVSKYQAIKLLSYKAIMCIKVST